MADGPRNLGDVYTKGMDPLETIYDAPEQGIRLPRRKWIVQPPWEPPSIPGMEGLQAFLERHFLPRQWQMFADQFIKLQQGQYFVKRPNWIEPPITARNLDIRTETAVALGAGSTNVVVLTFTIPDRWIGVIRRLGHELEDASFFGTVSWTIRINQRPVENYQAFLQQIGRFVNPTEIPFFTPLKTGDVVEWVASNPGAAPVGAFARFWGWMFPARVVSQDGSYDAYRVA